MTASRLTLITALVGAVLWFGVHSNVRADVLSSDNFQVMGIPGYPGEFSSSNTFRLFGTVGQPATGISSLNNFQIKGGFLNFPGQEATPAPAPAPTPTPTPTGGGPILDIFKKILAKISDLLTPCTGSDLNCDGRVDIYDAGIVFYWWGKDVANPQYANILTSFQARKRPSPDFNSDSQVDIYDLSILLARWTG